MYAYRVPYLQLDMLVFNGYGPGPKLHSYRQIMSRLESFVGELEKETGLANTYT